MTRRKRDLVERMNSMQYPRSGGVVDIEVDCVICRTRLYVPEASIDAVLTSLEQTGAAILICTCGQAQIVRWKAPRSRSRND
jgi:hypothetical protein